MTNDNVYPNNNVVVSLDEAINKLEYISEEGYPKDAVKYIIEHREESTPQLLNLLKRIIKDYNTLYTDFIGYLYAMFILAEFREQKAFELILKIADLPDEWPEDLLDDIITEDLHRIIASVYNGDIQAIKSLIEKPAINTWAQNALLHTLLTLIKSGNLSRDYVIDYLRTLFYHPTFTNNIDAMTHLVNTAGDLYPEELICEITEAFEKNLVDTQVVDMEWINRTLKMGKQRVLNEYVYNHRHDLIDDAISEMEHWPCFSQKNKPDEDSMEDFSSIELPDELSEEYEQYEDNTPFVREYKIGRNDPCPCGSGKKFKKCCLH